MATVEEVSASSENFMRNLPPDGTEDTCRVCRRFTYDGWRTCWACGHQPENCDLVVPITWSEHLGQMHTLLRNYKDGATTNVRRQAMIRLAAILWRFIDGHETCLARAVGIEGFDVVTTVPSSTKERDDRRGNLRTIVGWIDPLAARYRRVLRATDQVPQGRDYDERRYEATEDLRDANVLLIDDTWTAGGHAQSAAYALKQAGAAIVVCVPIGRHVRGDYKDDGDRLDAIPQPYDWDTCPVHDA